MTPSAPDLIAYKICLASTRPVQRTFIILTEGVYLNRDTPARSAAP